MPTNEEMGRENNWTETNNERGLCKEKNTTTYPQDTCKQETLGAGTEGGQVSGTYCS